MRLSQPAANQPRAGGAPQAPAVTILAQPGQAYIHTSTADNINSNFSYLDNPALNGQPNTKFFVVHDAQPYGYGELGDDQALGVWYDSGPHQWAIYNEDLTAMTQPQAWNVFIPPQDGTLILHDSSGANTVGPLTYIDSPQFNLEPNAVVFVQHVFNPGAPAAGDSPLGVPVNYFTGTVAVTYDAAAQKWAIRMADGSNFPIGKTFFALKASDDETFFTQTVTAGNLTFGYATALDSPLLNNNPDAQILVTQNYGTGLSNNHRVGVSYYAPTRRWYIFNQDSAAMPLGLMFNVLVIPPKHGYFLQTATAGNTTLNVTAIDNPDLNNNPDALIYVSHNWNPPEAPNGIYNDHPIGVQYLGGTWYVVNVDGAPMTEGLTFNVYYTWPRGNSFSASASVANTSASYTTLNNPLLNQAPDAIAIASYNLTPAGLPGGTYTEPVGMRYYSPLSAWQIFNNSGPTFEITQTYNVLIPPSGASFVVTATAPSGDHFDIDNPLTNGHPSAMVFATARDNSGINQKNTGVYYHYATQRWAIFNEDLSVMSANVVYDVFVTRFKVFLPSVLK